MNPSLSVGDRVGRLVILSAAEPYRRPSGVLVRRWNVRCDCRTEKTLNHHRLLAGTQSCGCIKIEQSKAMFTKHGEGAVHARTAEYRIWLTMKSRCNNPNVQRYDRYGGRGIKVCDRWELGENGKSGYECFIEDIGRRPSALHSLDRHPDNDGGYKPGNVRWATVDDQQKNKTGVHLVQIEGETFTLRQACTRLGIGYSAAKHRIGKGNTAEQALGLCS
jgi:hypothetical protein